MTASFKKSIFSLLACLSVQAGLAAEDNTSTMKQGKDSCTYYFDYSGAVVRKHFYGDWKPIAREEKKAYPNFLKVEDGNISVPAWYDRNKTFGLKVRELSPFFSAAWGEHDPKEVREESWQFFFLTPDSGIATCMQVRLDALATFTANFKFGTGQAPRVDNDPQQAPDCLNNVILVFDTSQGLYWSSFEPQKGWQIDKDQAGKERAKLYALLFRDNKTNEPIWVWNRQQTMHYHKTGENTACVTLLSKDQMDKVEKEGVDSAGEYTDEYAIDFQLIFTKPDAGILQWSSSNYSGMLFNIFVPFKLQPVKSLDEKSSRE